MGLDSIELLMEVEKYFSISIPDNEAEKAYTVGNLVDCVANILNVEKFDFSLRTETFNKIKGHIKLLCKTSVDFKITDKVKDHLDLNNKLLIQDLENILKLELVGINKTEILNNNYISRLKAWISFSTMYVDFKEITWKKYIDILLAYHLVWKSKPDSFNSKYEIYLAIMQITVDKIGVDYSEIGIEKSFTDDLGVD